MYIPNNLIILYNYLNQEYMKYFFFKNMFSILFKLFFRFTISFNLNLLSLNLISLFGRRALYKLERISVIFINFLHKGHIVFKDNAWSKQLLQKDCLQKGTICGSDNIERQIGHSRY